MKLKDFQFKINNKILVTKSFLQKINKTNNKICSLCGEYPETLKHLFFEYEKAKPFCQLPNFSNRAIGIINFERLSPNFIADSMNLFLNSVLD